MRNPMFHSGSPRAQASPHTAASSNRANQEGTGWSVPYDLYGHVPVHLEPYSTWLGFWMSNLVVAVFLISSAYLFYQYATLPFDLAEADIPHDQHFKVTPNGSPVLPEIGVQFQFGNGTGFHDPDIVEISFKQRYFYDGGKQGAKKISLPTRQCFPAGAGEGLTTGRCSSWAVENMEEAVEVETREEATLPEMQGIFNDEVYAFVQVTVRIRTENNLTAEVLKELYGGEIIMFASYDRFQLSDFRWNNLPGKTTKFFSQRFEAKRSLVSKVDVHFSTRSVQRDSHMIDLSILEEESSDLIVDKVHNELDDADDEGTLAKIYFRMNDIDKTVIMVPYTTLFDIMGVIGGFLALLNFMIGVPTTFMGKLSFTKFLKEAVDSGTLGVDAIDASGSVRMDKSNEVVKKLGSMRSRSNTMLSVSDAVNPVSVAVRWRKKAQGQTDGSRTRTHAPPIMTSIAMGEFQLPRNQEDVVSGESTTSVTVFSSTEYSPKNQNP
ncbi:hypothetical protein BSKO_00871 [Bryopsis sp. KO-2023]|nr:hypothetical protein BSKO_00871 [Bryopsis sp. KO-2023]